MYINDKKHNIPVIRNKIQLQYDYNRNINTNLEEKSFDKIGPPLRELEARMEEAA